MPSSERLECCGHDRPWPKEGTHPGTWRPSRAPKPSLSAKDEKMETNETNGNIYFDRAAGSDPLTRRKAGAVPTDRATGRWRPTHVLN